VEETVRVCAIENEAESEIVCSILKEQGIPFALRKSEDSAYDGIFAAHAPWAIIEAPLPYVDSINQVLRDVRQSHAAKQQAAPASKDKRRSLRPQVDIAVPVLLALCVIVLLGIVVNQKHLLDRYVGQQFIVWKWDAFEKAMVGRLQSNGRLRYKDYDRNLNFVYEERNVYSLGDRITTYYDDNEDGFSDRYVEKRGDGTVISQGEDHNENGVYEHEVVYHSKDTFVEYIDTDDDGLYDQAVIHNKGKIRTIDIRQELYGDQP